MDLQSLPDLDIKLLVAFEEIFKRQSLTAAAECLGITPSAISKYLQRMRHELRDPLFIRAPKSMRMEPTPRAESLRKPIGEILQAYFERIAFTQAFDPTTTDRVFRIHASELGMAMLMPLFTKALESRAPKCHIQAVSGSQKDVLDWLETGAIDLSISAFTKLEGIGLYQQRICDEHYVLLVRKGHPWTHERGPVDLKRFVSHSHVLVTAKSTGHVHGMAESQLREAIPASNIAMEVPSFLVAMFLLQETDHVLVAPKLGASMLGPKFGLVELECPLRLPTFTISQYWHERFALDPAGQWMRGLIHDIVNDTQNTFQTYQRPAGRSARESAKSPAAHA